MERIDYKKLGMEIKIRRLRADISQSKLAKQIGVSQSHLCNVENGRLSPSLRLLLSLAGFWVVRLMNCWQKLTLSSRRKRKMLLDN